MWGIMRCALNPPMMVFQAICRVIQVLQQVGWVGVTKHMHEKTEL